MDTCREVVRWLNDHADSRNAEGMRRFGISGGRVLGISVADLRQYAGTLGRDHELAVSLWNTGIHEARILASMTADPAQADDTLLESWVVDLDSWDVCDQVCKNFFAHCSGTPERAGRWCGRDEEFVRRAGFVLICEMAIHHKQMPDEAFLPYLDLIRRYAADDRNFVKKAVNWALREVGKRRFGISHACLDLADELAVSDSSAAKWIGKDAGREIREKLKMKKVV